MVRPRPGVHVVQVTSEPARSVDAARCSDHTKRGPLRRTLPFIAVGVACILAAYGCSMHIHIAKLVLANPPMSGRPTLGIVCNFRNEAFNIYEWMSHSYCQGVREFVMLNDDSTDSSVAEITRFKREHSFDHELTITLYNRSEVPWLVKARQAQAYNRMLARMRSDWVGVWDIDEFIFARHGFTDIPAVLDTMPRDVGAIYIHCVMFGSSGNIKHPSSLIHGNLLRTSNPTSVGKSLYRRRMAMRVGVHNADFDLRPWSILGNYVNADGSPWCIDPLRLANCPHIRPVPQEEDMLLMCNHYQVQSKEFWEINKLQYGTLNTQWDRKTWDDFYIRDKIYQDESITELSERTNASTCMRAHAGKRYTPTAR